MSLSFHRTKKLSALLFTFSQALTSPPANANTHDAQLHPDLISAVQKQSDDRLDSLLRFYPSLWNRGRLREAIKDKDIKKLSEYSAKCGVELYTNYIADMFRDEYQFTYDQAPDELSRAVLRICFEELEKLNKEQEFFRKDERFSLSNKEQSMIIDHAFQGIAEDRNTKFFSIAKSALNAIGDLSQRYSKVISQNPEYGAKECVAYLSYEVTQEVFGYVIFPDEPTLGLSRKKQKFILENGITTRLDRFFARAKLDISAEEARGLISQAVSDMSEYGDVRSKIRGLIIDKSRNISGEVKAEIALDSKQDPRTAILETSRKFALRVIDAIFESDDFKYLKTSYQYDRYTTQISPGQFIEDQVYKAVVERMINHLKKMKPNTKLSHPLPEQELKAEDIYNYLVKA